MTDQDLSDIGSMRTIAAPSIDSPHVVGEAHLECAHWNIRQESASLKVGKPAIEFRELSHLLGKLSMLPNSATCEVKPFDAASAPTTA